MTKNERKRMTNIDCLRVIMMLFIVIHHCIISGLGLKNIQNTSNCFYNQTLLLSFMNSFMVVAVNIFFLISGYFTINYTRKKFLNLLGETVFYSFVMYLVCVVLFGYSFSVIDVLKYTVFAFHFYWFIGVYLLLMLLSPYINIILNNIQKKEFTQLLGVLFFAFCLYGFVYPKGGGIIGANNGYSLFYAVFLYFCGNYIRKYRVDIRLGSLKYFIGYICFAIINWLLVCLCLYKNCGDYAWKLFSYNNPLILAASIMLFNSFLESKFDNCIAITVSRFGKNVLAVFLIHSFDLIIPYRFKPLEKVVSNLSLIWWPILIICYCCVIFVVCILIECIRSFVTKTIVKQLEKSNKKMIH